MASYTVGVDVGGTKILAAVVDADNNILATAKTDCPQDSGDSVLKAVGTVIRKAAKKASVDLADIDGIGAGVPGVVDADGTCVWAPNAPLSQTPVAARLREEFGVPVAVGNDVNVGTLGEKAFGAARSYDNVFGMFVGTGIGGGLVIDGKVVIGEHCVAAEIGHIIVDFEAALRGDEGGGEFEYYASRLGMERQIRDAAAAGRETMVMEALGDESDRIRSGVLKKALAANDEVATEVLARCARIIGLASVTVIHLCDPQALVFGGGVIEACADFMLPIIEETIKEHVAPGNGKPIRVIESELGDDAVVMGAVALARGVETESSGESAVPTIAAPEVDVDFPRMTAVALGSVTFDQVTYPRDTIVYPDGRVRKRKKKHWRESSGSIDKVGIEEVQNLCDQQADHLIIGTGFQDELKLTGKAQKWLEEQGVQVQLVPSSEAADAFNRVTGRKALLLRVKG